MHKAHDPSILRKWPSITAAVAAAALCIVLSHSVAAKCKGRGCVGKAIEKGAQDAGNAVEKGAQDTGNAVEKGAQDTGNAIEKGAQDTGNAVEKGAHDTGHAVEKGVHDTGHALEKAGQGIEHFFQQLLNFKPSCDLPDKKPELIDVHYREQCNPAFETYQHDLDVCYQAGGVSVTAADTSGATGAGTVVAGAGSYALAKVAYELCEQACRSKRHLDDCMANVDKGATATAQTADEAAKKNSEGQQRLSLATCVDSAYAGEKLVAMDRIAAECNATSNCDTMDSSYVDVFVARSNEIIDEIEKRRLESIERIKASGTTRGDYGPYIEDKLRSISLTYDDDDKTLVCRAWKPNLALWAKEETAYDATSAKVQWFFGRKLVLTTDATIDPKSKTLRSTGNIANLGQGQWQAQILSDDGSILGSFGFLYRPETSPP